MLGIEERLKAISYNIILRYASHIICHNKDFAMAKISYKARKKIPTKEFGLPGERKYPMPDASHAKNAKARATQMVKKGKLSSSSKAKIDAKANRILGHGGRS